MSDIYNQIKIDALLARKAGIKDKSLEASTRSLIYSTLIGQIDREVKDTNASLTDAMVVKNVKKLIDGVNDILSRNPTGELAQRSAVEQAVLSEYIPQQLDDVCLEQELVKLLDQLKAANVPIDKKVKGTLIKSLKSLYEGQYDGTKAAQIVDKLLSN